MSESERRARIAERVWMLKALQRAAARAGKTFAVFLAGALGLTVYVAIAAGMTCACTAHEPAAPDAITAPPSCSSVGCDGDEICKHDGACECPQPNGVTIVCQRAPAPPDAAPTVDAEPAADSPVTSPRIDAPTNGGA